ncbi:MAG: GNAT family N-acetyltransferase [Streptosporangiaceae bacterium]
MFTPRLEVRPPVEADRPRFVELMCDDEFMVFFDGARTAVQAHQWFDHMLAVCHEVPFGKQPVIERASGLIVGYVGVDWFDLDHERRLEIGWRLAPGYRGMGYATEAGQVLLGQAADTFSGDIFAIIDRGNRPSLNVARKLGFAFSKPILFAGEPRDLYRVRLNGPAGPLRNRRRAGATGWL